MDNILDVFSGDAFSTIAMTDAINKLPFVPGRLGTLIDWNEQGITTTSVAVEKISGVLKMIDPTPRGGPGHTKEKPARNAHILAVPHYQRDDGIYADSVQNVREFGQPQSLQTVMNVVNARMAEHARDFDVTLEYQRIGAVKGLILNADGSTLYDLFDEFDETQETEVDFDLDNASPASGALRTKCATVTRLIADNLGGAPIQGIHAICGNAFFDALIAHPEVVLSYRNTPFAEVLRAGYIYPNEQKVYGAFEFGGIVWENYRGSVNGTALVNTDKAHIFPMGAGIFKTVNAPADYIETVNTIGLPRYAKQFRMPNDKGITLEMQANSLSLCTRPNTLILGKRT
jgi:Phage major capsid protein E